MQRPNGSFILLSHLFTLPPLPPHLPPPPLSLVLSHSHSHTPSLSLPLHLSLSLSLSSSLSLSLSHFSRFPPSLLPQDGKKFIAIISDAASTGISLHANVASNSSSRRRVHYTIELPWAADKAIQQLGRTHRAGQLSAPHYNLVVTNLGGERRFAAAVSKRMASLGAITKGDRRAATGTDMEAFNVDSKHGRQALKRIFETLVKGSVTRPSTTSDEVLDEFVKDYNYTSHGEALGTGDNFNNNLNNNLDEEMRGIMRSSAFDVARTALDSIGLTEDGDVRKKADVRLFLNRIAGLPVGEQNLLFKLFSSTLVDIIAAAKKNGWYEGCVEDLIANEVTAEFTKAIACDDKRGEGRAQTFFSCYVLDRGWELQSLVKKESEDFEGDGTGDGGKGGEKGDEDEEMDDFIVDDDDDDEEEAEEVDAEEENKNENEDKNGDENTEVAATDNGSPFKKKTSSKLACAETGFYITKRKMIHGDYGVSSFSAYIYESHLLYPPD